MTRGSRFGTRGSGLRESSEPRIPSPHPRDEHASAGESSRHHRRREWHRTGQRAAFRRSGRPPAPRGHAGRRRRGAGARDRAVGRNRSLRVRRHGPARRQRAHDRRVRRALQLHRYPVLQRGRQSAQGPDPELRRGDRPPPGRERERPALCRASGHSDHDPAGQRGSDSLHRQQDRARGADRFTGILRVQGSGGAARQSAGARLRRTRDPRQRALPRDHRHAHAAPVRGRDARPRRRVGRLRRRAAVGPAGHRRRVRRGRAVARLARGIVRDGGRAARGRRLHRDVTMPTTITRIDARDIRSPTSRERDGSDAMSPDPDYSAAYAILHTDRPDGLSGHGLTFTAGRGNELCVAAIRSLAPLVQGLTLEHIQDDMAGFWRRLTSDSQMRWVGPEKGVLHLATAAVVNAVWDLYAKIERKPLWKLLADLSPEALVRCIDFRYITDALTPDEAIVLLRRHAPTRAAREAEIRATGYPAYTTSAGWLGYPDEKIRRLCREGVARGWSHFKIKVGRDLQDDMRRAALVRQEIGPNRKLMVDANQVWDVNQAIAWMHELARFDPWWIEEPTSPDDVLGHATIAKAVAPIGVATGEQCQNRVVFKQLMQAKAIRFCQIDSCRLGGVNEVLAVLLLAAKFGIPVCPHAGGVGLCEYVQHIAMFDYIAVSGSLENRVVEYVDHLHEHFVHPVVVRDGRYLAPTAPGYSIEMKPESRESYRYPDGPAWR